MVWLSPGGETCVTPPGTVLALRRLLAGLLARLLQGWSGSRGLTSPFSASLARWLRASSANLKSHRTSYVVATTAVREVKSRRPADWA